MNVILAGTIFAVVMSAGILVLLEIGRRIGVHQLAEEGETASQGLGAIEGAIFGLLGLILAFSFSGALSRFDARRHLVVEEANDIGTAWLRIALLPADAQPDMRDLFRGYLDSRIEVYRKVPRMEEVKAELARSANLQSEIWALAVSSSREAGIPQAPMLLLPALNAMFDITTTRTEAATSSAADYLRDARRTDSCVFVVRGLRHGDTASSERVALHRLRRCLVGDCVCDYRS
jgi:hypothetical protein